MKAADYAQWLSSNAPLRSLAEQGAVVFREHGCSGCHERGSTVHAPQLEGLYGKTVMLQGGDHVIADDRYFRDSVLRSEEHTSELQSLMRLSYAVFCLTKKNKKKNTI